MSHFYTIAVLPEGTSLDHIQETVEHLLEPYNERIEVPPYKERCYCVGRKAEDAAANKADAVVGTIDQIRNKFWEEHPRLNPLDDEELSEEQERQQDEDWKKALEPWRKAKQAFLVGHPEFDKPNPECEECGGTGDRETTYNPKSKWDWWVIGGRWDGAIRNERNPETNANVPALGDTEESNNLTTVAALLAQPDDKWIPFALVTPDGQFHDRGHMGYWAMVSEEKPKEAWHEQVRELLKPHATCVAVGLDLHI